MVVKVLVNTRRSMFACRTGKQMIGFLESLGFGLLGWDRRGGIIAGRLIHYLHVLTGQDEGIEIVEVSGDSFDVKAIKS